MCSYCISESRRRAATGSHPSRGGCRTCCSGSSRYAIGFRLGNVSIRHARKVVWGEWWWEEGARVEVSQRGIHTEFKGLAFLEDLDCYERMKRDSRGGWSYLSASLARIYDLVLDRRLWVGPGTLHGVLAMYVSVKEQWWRAARVLPRGCRRACAGAEGTIRRRAASWTSWFRRSSGRSQKFAPRYQARERSRVETAQKQSQQPEGASVHWRTASVRDEG